MAGNISASGKLSSKIFVKGPSTAAKDNVELPCGCTRTAKGFFKITKVDSNSPRHKPSGLKLKRARSKTRLDEPSVALSSSENMQQYRIYEDCCVEIEKLYGMLQSILKTEVQSFLNRSDMLARAQQKLTSGSSDVSTNSSANGGVLTATPKSKEKFILEIVSNELRKQVKCVCLCIYTV
ncbi:hypothetical protein EON65_15120 [archaeon]|nr:MAG: hypothetical protein EON65_15120 [archaeon]